MKSCDTKQLILGDMALADAPVVGHFIGHGTDHSLHHLLMLELMCDPDNYLSGIIKNPPGQQG